MSGLFRSLRERKVVQWALAYLAGAWVVLQVVDVLGGAWDVPVPTQRALIVVLGVGLAATVVLAWYHGEKGRQRVSGPELLILAALLGIGGLLVPLVGGGAEQAVEAGDAVSGDASDPDPAGAASELDPLAVAVLPFANLTGPDDAFLAVGITDELISHLYKVGGLHKVISRTSVMRYQDTETPVPEIAAALGVGSIVEGSVQRVDGRIKVVAQLVDARTDTHLWTEIYDDRSEREIFDVQSEITQAIARELAAVLSPAERDRIAAAPTENMEAYYAYVAARESFRLRQEDMLEAAERAVALDPEFAEAWGLKALVHALQVRVAMVDPDDPLEPRVDEALEAIGRAEALDPSLAEPVLARAMVLFWTGREGWEPLFLEAIDRAPSLALAHQWYGEALNFAGRAEEAVVAARRAVELDPLAPASQMDLVSALTSSGRVDEAWDRFQRELGLDAEVLPANLFGALLAGVHGEWVTSLRHHVRWARQARERTAFGPEGGGSYPDLVPLDAVEEAEAYLDSGPTVAGARARLRPGGPFAPSFRTVGRVQLVAARWYADEGRPDDAVQVLLEARRRAAADPGEDASYRAREAWLLRQPAMAQVRDDTRLRGDGA